MLERDMRKIVTRSPQLLQWHAGTFDPSVPNVSLHLP